MSSFDQRLKRAVLLLLIPVIGSTACARSRDARELGLFLVVSLTVVLANLMSDLVYAAIDPRIRLR